MNATHCQRWLARCASFVAPSAHFEPGAHEVAAIADDTTARRFVEAHSAAWVEKFWRRVRKSDTPDACWLWTGSRLPRGYGRFYPAWRVGLYAHRFSWEIANGREVPAELQVMHACDNPQCVNPAHLSVGTRSDNMQDCVAKGRCARVGLRGERHPNAKLTSAQVTEIRQRLVAGEGRRALAIEFGVTKTNVRFIAVGRAWRAS